jgi:hypothetical protein
MTEPLFSAAIASYKGAQCSGATLDSVHQELCSYDLTRRTACHLNLT